MTLAKEIGENTGYQSYLVQIRQVEANEKVSLAQAENIKGADIRIIAGALEAFAATEAGQSLLSKFGINLTETK